MCPQGIRAPLLCEAGTYQPDTGQSDCEACPEGYYCDGTSTTSYKSCPRGRYCLGSPDNTETVEKEFTGESNNGVADTHTISILRGTMHADQYPCPTGTYSNSIELTVDTDCTDCTGGYYCPYKGQTTVDLEIYPGYHGHSLTGLSKPDDFICPEAAYCEGGTETYTACPDGTWTLWQGSQQSSDCIPCMRGKFCKFTSMQSDSDFLSW